MHNPLVIEAIMLIAAIVVGVWSQSALPIYRNVLTVGSFRPR